jgi:hypothetical protein
MFIPVHLPLHQIGWAVRAQVNRYNIGTTQLKHRYNTGITQVQHRYSRGTTRVQHRYNTDTTQVQHRYSTGTTQAQQRYNTGTTQVQHRYPLQLQRTVIETALLTSERPLNIYHSTRYIVVTGIRSTLPKFSDRECHVTIITNKQL